MYMWTQSPSTTLGRNFNQHTQIVKPSNDKLEELGKAIEVRQQNIHQTHNQADPFTFQGTGTLVDNGAVLSTMPNSLPGVNT